MAKLGKGMLSSAEQAFVGRDEKRAPLKAPAWEAIFQGYEWRHHVTRRPEWRAETIRTFIIEFCYGSVNLSLEELGNSSTNNVQI